MNAHPTVGCATHVLYEALHTACTRSYVYVRDDRLIVHSASGAGDAGDLTAYRRLPAARACMLK